MAELPELNPVIHGKLRLALLSLLVGVEEAEFTWLRAKTARASFWSKGCIVSKQPDPSARIRSSDSASRRGNTRSRGVSAGRHFTKKSEEVMTDRRELYRSPNGDAWFLGREPANGQAFIIHQPNAPSGGRLSHIELAAFLSSGTGPERQALLRLIGTLVDVPPYAERQ